jgi:hypothetical protein
MNHESDENYKDGSFMDDLTDSVQLTAGIFKDLLPLININDYEQPMMQLIGTLLDSNLIHGTDYESYQPKILLEAKQLLKKELVTEKNKAIERAQKNQSAKYSANDEDKEIGNTQLSLYAKLLLPFYEKNQAVKQLFNQMLSSRDKKLKFVTTQLLLKDRKQVPDTLISYFAKLDAYRYELYSFLKDNNLLKMFPQVWNNHIELAKSKLYTLSGFDKPDSLVYIDQIIVYQKDRKGLVCFFKYKQKKDDMNWKLTSVGLLPPDPVQFEWADEKDDSFDKNYNFTSFNEGKLNEEQPLKDQLLKAVRKLKYAMRKSAAEFYENDDTANESYKVSFKE